MPKKKPEKPVNLNTEILRQIRDNTATTNKRVDELTERVSLMHGELAVAIGETNERVDALADAVRGTNERIELLHTRLVKTDMRLSSQHAEILAGLEQLREQLVSNAARDAAVSDLAGRVEALEKKAAAS